MRTLSLFVWTPLLAVLPLAGCASNGPGLVLSPVGPPVSHSTAGSASALAEPAVEWETGGPTGERTRPGPFDAQPANGSTARRGVHTNSDRVLISPSLPYPEPGAKFLNGI